MAVFSIGSSAGLLLRRVVPAIVATLAAYSGLASATALFLRQHYLTALVTASPVHRPEGSMWNIAHKHQVLEKTGPRPGGRAWPVRAVLMRAGAMAMGVGLAACGGGSPPSRVATGPTTTTTTGPSGEGAGGATSPLAYSSCMRSHGVPDFPHPTGDGGVPKDAVISAFRQVSNSQAQRASHDCARLLLPEAR